VFYLYNSETSWNRRGRPQDVVFDYQMLEYIKVYSMHVKTGEVRGHICMENHWRMYEYNVTGRIEVLNTTAWRRQYRPNFKALCMGFMFEVNIALFPKIL